MPLPSDLRKQAQRVLGTLSIRVLLQKCPTLAVWGALTPLAENYATDGKEVYAHISVFLKGHLVDQSEREDFKRAFRCAARRIGLPIPLSNDPTDLFFTPLGPAHAQHPHLARAFVSMALGSGPPATEDTSSARSWQRRAVAWFCPNHTRLQAAIRFDQSAHCARRFDDWRRGEDPVGEGEKSLFAAYDRVMAASGRNRSDVVGPPRVFWNGTSLSIEAETSRRTQAVRLGPFPTPLKPGNILTISAPWPATLPWFCAGQSQNIDLAPGDEEILVFDADSGVLLVRTPIDAREIAIAAERLVILSKRDFTAPAFGPGLPAEDPEHRVAWIAAGEALIFDDGRSFSFTSPGEAAIWLDATTLGHYASRPLLACNGELVIAIDPEIGGRERILRARHAHGRAFTDITVGEDGRTRIPFCRLGLDAPGDPILIRFEVLAPGAAGDETARAELSISAWIWPGVSAFPGDPARIPRPGNFLPARSAGLRETPAGLEVDDRADVDAPILGLSEGEDIREFTLALRRETLWHDRLATGDRVRVPRGKTLVLGQAARHDTLTVTSADTHADILALGREIRRPFITRASWEIGASILEAPTSDDRIALRRQDGGIDVLARVRHVADPTDITCHETSEALQIGITPRSHVDAIRVRIEWVDGTVQEGDTPLGRTPTPLQGLRQVSVKQDIDTGRTTILLPQRVEASPGRAILLARAGGQNDFDPLTDADGAVLAVGLAGRVASTDAATLGQLARFLAERSPTALGEQMRTALLPAYEAAIAQLGASRMAGSIKAPLLSVPAREGNTPRHDLAGVAPWIFEAPGAAFLNLDPASGLAGLSALFAFPDAPDLPDPLGDQPMQDWLSRITTEADLPSELSAEALEHAFRTLRFRLGDTDMRELVTDGPLARTTKLITEPHVDDLDQIRAFDTSGGGDPARARIAAAIERFARAAALRQSESHVREIARRTGLSRQDMGPALTLMLRAGLEFFIYFRGLWSHAAGQHERQT